MSQSSVESKNEHKLTQMDAREHKWTHIGTRVRTEQNVQNGDNLTQVEWIIMFLGSLGALGSQESCFL